ncbi:hypothetical protein [Uliginosibacterium sp. H1]|uniref:hypothetical protein n=1 Tax=Uliginosibacterium sp. H1 TaxID=3114757 RepID=UPI002E18FD7A|nr:hypothetical protein [Uliginosibacterium sp. H1]
MYAAARSHPRTHERPTRKPAIATVFLSYTRPDVLKARKIARRLWQSDIAVAMYNPHEPWDDPIHEMHALAASSTCVVWFSNGRPPTDWILPELERAASCEVPVLDLASIADLPGVIDAIRARDWRRNVADRFHPGPLPQPDGTVAGDLKQLEALFHRQAGERSDFIREHAKLARMESDADEGNRALSVALTCAPIAACMVLLLATLIALFFSVSVAGVLFGLMLACAAVTPRIWRWANRYDGKTSLRYWL